MDSIGVMMLHPMNTLEEELLDKHFTLYRLWNYPDQKHRQQFLEENSNSIRAIVSSGVAGVNAELIKALPKLEIISNFGVGLDKIDLNKCKEKGIRVTNTPDVLTQDVADMAIGLILSVLRRIVNCDRFVRHGLWKTGDFELTTRFSGKSVGIIGLGRIGYAIAKRAEGFECPISYHARSEKPNTNYKYYPNVVELASNCQILVIACALTDETRHIDKQYSLMEWSGMKCFFILFHHFSVFGQHVMESFFISSNFGWNGMNESME